MRPLQNWDAEHRLGVRRWIFPRAEAVLGAPKVVATGFAEVSE
jgi:hypothetical protein